MRWLGRWRCSLPPSPADTVAAAAAAVAEVAEVARAAVVAATAAVEEGVLGKLRLCLRHR